MRYRSYIEYFYRIINVALSAAAAYFVFQKIYNEYHSYLPPYEKLNDLNNATGIGTVLRENSQGLRELYNHAFEMSLLYSLAAFIVTFITIEYLYRSKDKSSNDATKRIYEHLGAWKERNIMNNSDINKENQEYLKEYFKMK